MSIKSMQSAQMTPLKQAFLKLEEMQTKLEAIDRSAKEPVAIIGAGCRFPGEASSPDAFWQLLRQGVDAIGEIPTDRWHVDAYYDPRPGSPGKMITRWGGFLEGVGRFDSQFFGISPREAVSMDPQQRLLLEVSWEALENAGQAPDKLSRTQTGVFIGVCKNDYLMLQLKDNDPSLYDLYFASGNAHSIMSGRLSYVLGLQGPSISIDTACSSSLVAVHLACQSLRIGECRTALAGGVNVILSPENTISFSRASMLAADGRCKTFDAAADGFVQGEGCGVVVLKRLSDALTDGNRILALIRGSAVNQDGPSSGLTAPNGPSQVAVIRQALSNAGVHPAKVGYVEAHGTATALGDPIEVQALGEAFGRDRDETAPMMIGSVKTNIGHLETAAGIASLIKVVLALQHREIPKHLHLKKLNPFVRWDELPIVVPTEHTAWKPIDGTRIAGVSSFGFSGTNAHIVLQEAPERQHEPNADERPLHLFALSAKSENCLMTLCRRFHERLTEKPLLDLADVCFTANAGRAHFSHRLATVVESTDTLCEKLGAFAKGQSSTDVLYRKVPSGDQPRISFLFTGQGSQYAEMGRRLFETQPIFRAAMEQCDRIIGAQMGGALLHVLYPQSGSGLTPGALLDQTGCAQPAIFAIGYSLVQLWHSWGIEPSAVMGHSLGEYVAACVAGVFSLEDGLKLIAARSRLMQELPAGGQMAAVQADERRVAAAIGIWADEVSIAAVNGPQNVVISGSGRAVAAVLADLASVGVGFKPLNVSHAFHSHLVDPMLDEFERIASEVRYSAPRIRLISNVSGQIATGDDIADASYWRRHIRQPIRFQASLETLYHLGYRLFVEIGPHPVLLGMGAGCLSNGDEIWIASLRKNRDDWQQMLTGLGELYGQGVEVDWPGFDKCYRRQRLALPTYSFQREHYWIVPPEPSASIQGQLSLPARFSTHPLLGHRLKIPLTETVFAVRFSTEALPFLADHVVHSLVVFPATAYLEMITAAARDFFEVPDVTVESLAIKEPLLLSDDGYRSVHLVLRPTAERVADFQLFSLADENDDSQWKLHASGQVQGHVGWQPKTECVVESFAMIKTRCCHSVDVGEFYQGLKARGLDFGPSFRGIEELWRCDGEAFARIQLPLAVLSPNEAYHVHPALLDACIQAVAAAVPDFDPDDIRSDIYMPMGLDLFRYEGRARKKLFSHVLIEASDSDQPETMKVQVRVFDPGEKPIACLSGLHLKRVDLHALLRVAENNLNEWFYEVLWQLREPGFAENPASPYLLEPLRIAGRTAPLLPELGAQLGVGIYNTLNHDLDMLCAAYIVSGLRKLGFEFTVGRTVAHNRVAKELNVDEQHRRLLDRFLQILTEDGILAEHTDGWQVRSQPGHVDPEALCAEMLEKYRDQDVELSLLRQCANELAALLRAEADPLQLLFPDGNLELASKIYRATPLAGTMNSVVRGAVQAAISQLPKSVKKIRILEIGAGTGGTTAHVLPVLPHERTDYVFTDIGQTFLTRAAKIFSDYPFLDYKLLDIEKQPSQQGFASLRFDLVIAANVLHATADLSVTLAHVKQLLSPQGLLLLVEATRQKRWYDLTFGFTVGWWKFTDLKRRSSSPLLDQHQWMALLTETGFGGMAAIPAAGSTGPLTDNAVILARAPGIERFISVNSAREALSLRKAHGSWIIFADRGGLSEQLAALFRAAGLRCCLVSPGERYEVAAENHWIVNPSQPDDFRRLWRDTVGSDGAPCRGVVHLWALDDSLVTEPSADQLMREQDRGCRSILYLLQAVHALAAGEPPEFWLVTRGIHPAGGQVPLVPVHAPVWGLGKVIALEHPELRCVCVDMDPSKDANEARALFAEIVSRDGEDNIAFRQDRRYVARLARSQEPSFKADRAREIVRSQRWELTIPGTLEGLELKSVPRQLPGAGKVEIRICATGLNFRDVLNVLGMRRDPELLGGECAGTIAAVGQGVDDLRVGDEVVAVTQGAFGMLVTTGIELVAPKPRQMTFEQAAAAPLAYLTANYALHRVGRMRQGERILIHAAAGGVGMAAVQLAMCAGAEIFATAGNPQKRDFLRSIGVRHVMDSRSLDFAETVRVQTRGEGVDIVLNALTDEFIPKSLALLRANGRFLEIGKSQIWTPQQVAAVNPNATYFAIDLAETLLSDPLTLRPMFLDLMAGLAKGTLKPLPVKSFSFQQTPDAFRYMAQARHIGKIVISQPNNIELPTPITCSGVPVSPLRPNGTYLITGGLAGLGLLVAKWMVTNGARSLALMARSEPGDTALTAVAQMRQAGASVTVLRGDVAAEKDLDISLARISALGLPLVGVVHCAGVLDDGLLLRQPWERFQNVMAPKVRGAWMLHNKTLDAPLEMFVLFSSMSAIFGSAGQANHAAANAFLDALVHYRRAHSLPGLSLNWGAWSEIGAAVKHDVGRRISRIGVGTISPEMGLRALTATINSGAAQVAISPVNWPRFLSQFSVNALPPFFRTMAQQTQQRLKTQDIDAQSASGHTAAEPPLLKRLSAAAPPKRRSILLSDIQSKALRALGLDGSNEMDFRQPLSELGLDSLMAVELRNLLGKELLRSLPATLLFDYPSIDKLTDYLLNLIFGSHEFEPIPGADRPMPIIANSDALAAIESLSDEEIDQMFDEREVKQTRE